MDSAEHNQSSPKHNSAKPRKRMPIKLSKKTLKILAVMLVVIALPAVAYKMGDTHGAKRQKELDKKNRTAFPNSITNRTDVSRRFSAIGVISEATDKQVKLKDSRGKEKTASITKETIITGSDGKKTDSKALKKDQKIIISGTKDEKGDGQTATRIRIQR